MKKLIYTTCLLFAFNVSFGQYNECAGKSEVRETEYKEVKDKSTGQVKRVEIKTLPQTAVQDVHGNLKGSKYDLAIDGAFKGQTIFVLNICGNTMEYAKTAVASKGFSMVEARNGVPTVAELKEYLSKSCQFWLLSGASVMLTKEHVDVIVEYFNSGRGVYIWNDNTPYHADGNVITERLFGITMSGDYYANQVIRFKSDSLNYGMVPNHLITTGLESVYEGITVSTISPDQNQQFTPIMYSSDGNIVAAVYEMYGKRLIIDGGFTRLCVNWDNAGTDRYIKNASAWLANVERFGKEVSELAK